MSHWKVLLIIGFLGITAAAPSLANAPITADSRVKTLVYNENDVFSLTTDYGYQSSIEFGKTEEIQTVSVGDRTTWQIIPAGHRIFIRAMEYDANTNMTIITNKRTYLFDLHSVRPNEKTHNQVSYIIRFFYPDEQPPAPIQHEVSSSDLMENVFVEPAGSNYQYTYTGDDSLAPTKIFDDGRTTYFKLRPTGLPPTIYRVAADGSEQAVPTSQKNEYTLVPLIAGRFTIRYSPTLAVCVYNESLQPRVGNR